MIVQVHVQNVSHCAEVASETDPDRFERSLPLAGRINDEIQLRIVRSPSSTFSGEPSVFFNAYARDDGSLRLRMTRGVDRDGERDDTFDDVDVITFLLQCERVSDAAIVSPHPLLITSHPVCSQRLSLFSFSSGIRLRSLCVTSTTTHLFSWTLHTRRASTRFDSCFRFSLILFSLLRSVFAAHSCWNDHLQTTDCSGQGYGSQW